MDIGNGAGEGGMDDDPVQVGDDQERWVFQGRGVKLQLLEGILEVFALALVLPAEAGAFPHVRPAIPAPGLGGALLEAVPGAGGVGLGGRGLVQEAAQIEKVLLGGGALLEVGVSPFGDELVGGHVTSGQIRGAVWTALGRPRRWSSSGGTVNIPHSKNTRREKRAPWQAHLRRSSATN